MIPIGLPSTSFVLLIVAMLTTTLIWFVWTLRFTLLRKKASNRNVLLAYLVTMAIALFTLFKIVDVYLQVAEYQRASNASYRPTLGILQRLGHIDMPAGTQLQLAIANLKESFQIAIFPVPVVISGTQALRVERYSHIETDHNYQAVGVIPTHLRVIGQGISLQEGWRCDATQPIEFTLNPDGDVSTFSACTLAQGNTADGIVLPAGTSLRASAGNAYTDGFVDIDRWTLHVQSDAEINIDGLALADANVALDDLRRLYEISSALLIRDTQFGKISHAAGSTVHLNPRRLRETYSSAWLIESLDEALSPAQPNTVPLTRIIQDRSGKLLAILPDR